MIFLLSIELPTKSILLQLYSSCRAPLQNEVQSFALVTFNVELNLTNIVHFLGPQHFRLYSVFPGKPRQVPLIRPQGQLQLPAPL